MQVLSFQGRVWVGTSLFSMTFDPFVFRNGKHDVLLLQWHTFSLHFLPPEGDGVISMQVLSFQGGFWVETSLFSVTFVPLVFRNGKHDVLLLQGHTLLLYFFHQLREMVRSQYGCCLFKAESGLGPRYFL